jgi:hypothetical protein
MNKEDLASYLQNAAEGLRAGAYMFMATPHVAGVMRVISGLLDIGATIARAGDDPVEKITRLLDLDQQMRAERAEVDAEADRKFSE